MVVCSRCGAENPEGVKFCGECGSPLALVCPACGAPNLTGRKFCGECGAPLESAAAAGAPTPEPPTAPAAAERRLVSVLFADLVGFTPLSESRDPEEARELLSRYFDSCRRLVELYGGTVEKFIGDAVMAVWGTPVAQEDDAERAVRTALDLVAAVSALGDEVRVPELRARAGVLTGEAAVNLAAAGEGMVAGDLVNTAARIQAAAEPGTVLVGEATRRASEQAIAFEEAGAHELKGKTEPIALWRAVRVTAARGGALRSEGLEAPFVGRERELRLVKELFHGSWEQSRAQLVQISGIAGIGKSRLAWEFFKYLDGLADNIFWHRGRCLAYGEGVAYWALAEMVRTRAQILEGEEVEGAREKLQACLAEHVPDVEERAWIGPRLANLLGLEERADSDRQDLFAAWRLFFERLCDEQPVVLMFEDLQWADPALLSFVEYLLEWSSSQRLYVMAVSRPELAEQHPDFGRSIRNAATLALEPLSDAEMSALLDGYVPGLPEQLRSQVLARAQGVPLYAVETVRMLLDRGLLRQDGPVYRPTGEIESLDVPETLHALAASRLDGLPADERSVVQQACVLGKSFNVRALAALSGRNEQELEPLLAALVRKEVLSLQADPRQPERGQYGFLQELLRQVAYETLSRKDRKARHLAAVAALERTFEGVEQDVPEVIASHLLSALEAAPEDADADEIRTRAGEALLEASERAAALAAPEEAQRHLDQAASLAGDDAEFRVGLLERAGVLAFQAGNTAAARERLEQALSFYQEQGDSRAAARAGVALADVDLSEGRIEEAAERFTEALPELEQDGPSQELAASLGQLGRMQVLRREPEAVATLERALGLAELLALDEVFVQALTSRALTLVYEGRPREARLLLEAALARARADGLHGAWWRAANNLGVLLGDADQTAEQMKLLEEIEVQARQRGDREQLAAARSAAISPLAALGRWQEALARSSEVDQLQASPWARAEMSFIVPLLCEQGDLEAAERLLRGQEWQRDAEQIDISASFAAIEARLLRAQGRLPEALAAVDRCLLHRSELGSTNSIVKSGLVEALEACLELDDLDRAGEILADIDRLQPGELTPLLEAQRHRFHARLDARHGNHNDIDIDGNYAAAEKIFSEHGLVFRNAVMQLEHAEWLTSQGRAAEAQRLLAQARETFEQLEAKPWLERLAAAEAAAPANVPA
jgi:class 3 adenylate cyclase/tetratricopeptide (TPR) repeat protein